MGRWPRLLIIAFITYSLAYLDRVNYGFGAAAGLADSLHISPLLTALLGATFFLGYFAFQIPGGYYASQRSAKRLVFWGLLLWGVCASGTGLITNIPLLFADRFVLGVVESMVLPAMIVFLSNWFTRGERSRANTVLILGNPVTVLWASIVSGYLIAWIGWRGMFVAEGIPSIVWAFVWLALAQDSPAEASWLPESERTRLLDRLAAEQRTLAPVPSLGAALRLPSVVVLSAQYFFWSLGVYGFVLWLPSMVKAGLQQGIVATGWLSAIPYAAAVVAMLLVSAYADRTGHRRVVVAVAMFVAAAAFYVSYLTGGARFEVAYVALIVAGAAIYAPYGPFFAMITDLVPKSVAGAATAMINSFGALGGFVGTYLVGYLNGLTGTSAASFSLLAASLLVAGILTVLVRVARETPVPSPA
ncbi:MAG TPA: MFS transporter [Candidatus Elarobacter sp.]|jgi:sugar phosphate permease|nr:MFS transporter [Candidatus Elarobacter sp.]